MAQLRPTASGAADHVRLSVSQSGCDISGSNNCISPSLSPATASCQLTLYEDDKALETSRSWGLLSLAGFLLFLLGAGVALATALPLEMLRTRSNLMPDGTSTRYTLAQGGSKVSVARTYYIAADPVDWIFAPGGIDLCQSNYTLALNLNTNVSALGVPIKKAQYREYVDDTFSQLKPGNATTAHLGIMGPIIYAAAGDVIQVSFLNNLPFAVNIDLPASDAIQVPYDGIQPGSRVTYLWQVRSEAGPEPQLHAPSSRLWIYRSSLDPMAHDNAGLLGPLIVTNAGLANADGTTANVDMDVVTSGQVFNESASAFAAANKAVLSSFPSLAQVPAINGYTYCHLPAIDLNIGQQIRWHVASLGGALDGLHDFGWHGNVLSLDGRNVDQIVVMPGYSMTAQLIADNPGTWLFHCNVLAHAQGGMVALYSVHGVAPALQSTGRQQVYYIAAEEGEWDYGPAGGNLCSGTVQPYTINELVYMGNTSLSSEDGFSIGSMYLKARYVQYTDASFTRKVPQQAYLGLLGPVIRAQVGDIVSVVFLNKMSFPTSLHAHGMFQDKDSEGAPYDDGTPANMTNDDIIYPGGNYTYIWKVPARSGPGPNDASSITWLYHSNIDQIAQLYAGLLGVLVITEAGGTNPATGLPPGVDQELFLYFGVTREMLSALYGANLDRYLGPSANRTALAADAYFVESNIKRHINGFMFCNMPVFNFTQGQNVRLYMLSAGSQGEVHAPNVASVHFLWNHMHVSSLMLAAGQTETGDVQFEVPGMAYVLQCQNSDHVVEGMDAIFNVFPSNATQAIASFTGINRTYYIAAVGLSWDYAPRGYIQCTPKNYQHEAAAWIQASNVTLGTRYIKAMYRLYNDSTFTTMVASSPVYGTVGPTIIAEVGDIITVVFRNLLGFEASFDPGPTLISLNHGNGGTSVNSYDTYTYQWLVPPQAGPTAGDLSTAVYTYTSSVDIIAHPAAGLVGAVLIGQAGTFNQAGLPVGVDQVVPLLAMVMDENYSPYLITNMQLNNLPVSSWLVTNGRFQLSNQMHSINGYVFCNMPTVRIPLGSRVRWLLMTYGDTTGIHTPTFPGQVLLTKAGPSATHQMTPSTATAMDIYATTTGLWTIQCAVHDHLTAGMMASMEIYQ